MKSKAMVSLGRQGGVARARSLSGARRAEIASVAARRRWQRPALVIDADPRDPGELLNFVANHGAKVSRKTASCDVAGVTMRALRASRSDPFLARMLPVFLWRARHEIDVDDLVARSRAAKLDAVLGYFLELTARVTGFRGYAGAISRLRKDASGRRPKYFYEGTGKRPFEAMAAEEGTPSFARRWGLLTGTSVDSFASYFEKVRDL
jgi:hypothetical protein